MGGALLPGAGEFPLPAGRTRRRRRRRGTQRNPLQLLRHGHRAGRHGGDLHASARSGADHAAGRRHRLRFLDAPPQGRAGQGRRRRRLGTALVHGCVGCDVPHHHERRPPPRRDDGDAALRPPRHRGLHRGQAGARPAAHVQSLGSRHRRLHDGGQGRRALGAQIRRDDLQGPARARAVGQDHARDLRLCRARNHLHRPHQPAEQSLVLRADQLDEPVRRTAAAALRRMSARLDQPRQPCDQPVRGGRAS